MNAEDNACVHNSTSRNSSMYETASACVTDASKRSFQHSQECKRPSALGEPQSSLATQQNLTFLGNKNKTGFLAGGSTYTKISSDDSITQKSSDTQVVPCNTLHNGSKFSEIVPDVGTTLQPQLADKNTCFSGNKNKTGFSDGDYCGANITDDSSYDNNVENCGDVTDVMDTAILEQDLYQNCSRNSSDYSGKIQNSVCDTVYTNAIRTDVFGFIPKGPLRLYDGNPTNSNSIPDIIMAHLMIKDSGIPNYLGCRIPVPSNLKCHIWSHYLANYWDK